MYQLRSVMFKLIYATIFASSLFSSVELYHLEELTQKELNKEFINKVLKNVVEDMEADEEIISRYFSPSYVQYVDGRMLNYSDFVKYMQLQKTSLASASILIDHCIVDGNSICTVHRINALKKTGENIAVKVISYFEIENGKIILCDELTYLLKGEENDQQIGSMK